MKPGDGNVPYTHREVFLNSPFAVGQGLSTYASFRSGDFNRGEKIEPKETIEDIFNDWNAQKVVTGTDVLWNELVKSELIRGKYKSEMIVEFLAKRAPNIQQETYENISDLHRFEPLKDLDEESIEWILKTDFAGEQLYNKDQLINKLFRNRRKWMSYFNTLRGYGTGLVSSGKLEQDVVVQLLLYVVDKFNSNEYDVFSDKNNRDALLRSDNFLNNKPKSNHGTKDHPEWVNHRAVADGPDYRASTYTSDLSYSSNITNQRAAGLIKEYPIIRKVLINGKLSETSDPHPLSEFINCSSLTVDNFWELFDMIDLDYEFIQNITCQKSVGGNGGTAESYITYNDNLELYGDYAASDPSGYLTRDGKQASSTATIHTQNIPVSNYDRITFELGGYSKVYNGIRDAYIESTTKIKVGDQETVWDAGENPPNSYVFSITDENSIDILMSASGGTD